MTDLQRNAQRKALQYALRKLDYLIPESPFRFGDDASPEDDAFFEAAVDLFEQLETQLNKQLEALSNDDASS